MTTADETSSHEGTDEPSGQRAGLLPSAPEVSDGPIGREIAERYFIEGLLGKGPIGSTYKAQRKADGQLVALKLLDPTLRADETAWRRFVREVEASKQLEHRHVAQVLEQGEDEQAGPFICREWVDGEDLITAAGRAQLTPRRLCDLLIQLLSAISEAHRRGVVHRDLKPQNVLVTRDADGRECVKVCDFGHGTRGRSVPEYLAPEQVAGDTVDGQADVYTVGVLLYQLLTDVVPFRGDDAEQTLELVKSAPLVSPREHKVDRPLPRELDAICSKALAKEPQARHKSPREMSQALRAVVGLLGGRSDEPLGSSAFAERSGAVVDTASSERMTIPGEQLRSRHKFWLGAGLVALVCAAVLYDPEPPASKPAIDGADVGRLDNERGRGGEELAKGIQLLRSGEAAPAISELRKARRSLGDTPEVLRALGEALVLNGDTAEGTSLLTRYLEIEPNARDRQFVQSLVRRSESE